MKSPNLDRPTLNCFFTLVEYFTKNKFDQKGWNSEKMKAHAAPDMPSKLLFFFFFLSKENQNSTHALLQAISTTVVHMGVLHKIRGTSKKRRKKRRLKKRKKKRSKPKSHSFKKRVKTIHT